MQFHLLELIQPELIAIDIPAATDEDSIRQVSALLQKGGFSAAAFADDVVTREQTFPTGLPTAPYGVAIPHADPDHVDHSGVAIGVLREPVPFGQMGTDGSIKVAARVLFLLAIKEREKQIGLISELMRMLQSPAFLTNIVQSESSAAIYTMMQEFLI